jgi:predicted Fe-Mo cluster-binding NifX family protein
MRIAMPLTETGRFNPHFGQARAFRVVDVDDCGKQVRSTYQLEVPAPDGCGAIPALLAREGVMLVIVGGIGHGALTRLQRFRIEPLVGARGDDPAAIMSEFLDGRLTLSPQTCCDHGTATSRSDRTGEELGHSHAHRRGSSGSCCATEQEMA